MNRKFDTYMYENDDFLTVAAAGNSGMKSDDRHILSSVASPSSNKNGISVGASQSAGKDIYSGSMLGMDYLACFSSRGPTMDGRIKPDIVAPGFNILSARALPDKAGECDPDKRPALRQSSEGLSFKAGTSMASPVVTGSTALVRQYLKSSYYEYRHMNPSSALIKAIILNGGRDMKGAQDWFYGSEFIQVSPYDAHVGFGRVDLSNSMPLPDNSLNKDMRLHTYDRMRISSDDVQEYIFYIDETCSSDSSEVSVTLVWTDPPSTSGCTRCLLNDLDLSLSINKGKTYFPNGKYGKDDVNNVERIRASIHIGDEVHVSIVGANLSTEYQNYALVATGCGLSATEQLSDPTLSPIKQPTRYLSTSPSIANSNKPTANKIVPSTSPTMATSVNPTIENISPTLNPSSANAETFDISTGYEGSAYGNGNMFTILTKSANIVITNFYIHTHSDGIVSVEIYTRDGTFEGYERRPGAWNLLSAIEVQGQGAGKPTPLPSKSFEPIQIDAQSRKSFYITLSNGDLLYSLGDGSMEPIASTDEIDVFEGCGKSYKFRTTFKDRRWNGDIVYTAFRGGVVKTKLPTPSPTKIPSIEPTQAIVETESPSLEISPTPTLEPSISIDTNTPSTGFHQSHSLETVYSGSESSDGVMFNIVAQKHLQITNFYFHTESNAVEIVDVYLRKSSHAGYERRPKAWNLIIHTNVDCKGRSQPTKLVVNSFEPIELLQGDMYSFYITIKSTRNAMISTSGSDTGTEIAANDELVMLEGVGKQGFFGATILSKQFDGGIIYDMLEN